MISVSTQKTAKRNESHSLETKRLSEWQFGSKVFVSRPTLGAKPLRANEVLERIGTPEAIGVLRELSRKSLPMELPQDIESSLARLEKRRVATSEPRP